MQVRSGLLRAQGEILVAFCAIVGAFKFTDDTEYECDAQQAGHVRRLVRYFATGTASGSMPASLRVLFGLISR